MAVSGLRMVIVLRPVAGMRCRAWIVAAEKLGCLTLVVREDNKKAFETWAMRTCCYVNTFCTTRTSLHLAGC